MLSFMIYNMSRAVIEYLTYLTSTRSKNISTAKKSTPRRILVVVFQKYPMTTFPQRRRERKEKGENTFIFV